MTTSMKTVALYLCATTLALSASKPAPERVAPNDNRHPAGTLEKGVLTLKLEARHGLWQPEGDAGRSVDVAAFAEEGKPMSAPGPLIRVPVGTEVHATIRNVLDRPISVIGFGATPGSPDSVVIAPHASK